MCNENILNKIKNLLNKTVENGCTESEAISAFEMARKLMLKHKIEEKDIISSSEKEVIRIILDKYNASIIWILLLIKSFAKNFGVLYYFTKDGRKIYPVLFGIKEDVYCVKELIDCAYNIAEEKSFQYVNKCRQFVKSVKGIRQSWLLGFVNGIDSRYTKQNENNEYALVLKVDKDVKEQYNKEIENCSKKQIKRNVSVNDKLAYTNGHTEGSKFATTSLTE